MFFSDGSATKVDATLVGSCVQVFTHLVILLVTLDFFRRREYYAWFISMSVFINSNIYHICKAAWYCFGLLLERTRLLDHINSTHAAIAVLLIIAIGEAGGGDHAIAYRLLLYMITQFAVVAFPYQLKSVIVTVTYVLLVVVFEYTWVRANRLPLRQRFALRYAIPAVPSGLLAVVFYMEPPFLPGEISHGLWHTFIFLTLWLTVRAVNDQSSGDRDSIM